VRLAGDEMGNGDGGRRAMATAAMRGDATTSLRE